MFVRKLSRDFGFQEGIKISTEWSHTMENEADFYANTLNPKACEEYIKALQSIILFPKSEKHTASKDRLYNALVAQSMWMLSGKSVSKL